jgi:Ca2+-binding RTX toxin-like protein
MADQSVLDGEINEDDETVLDQPVGDQHSAFIEDEELHDQLADQGEGDERTALTAAHQGSRATSTPSDEAAAFNPSTEPDLFDEISGRAGDRASASNRSFDDALTSDPANALLGGLDSELSTADGNPAQNADDSRGREPATAAEQNPGAGGAANAIGDLQPNGDDAQSTNGPLGPNATANENPALDLDLFGQADPSDSSSSDGLGGSGDQSGLAGAGSGNDDQQEYIAGDDGQTASQVSGGGGGGGGGGVNPIIGDRFDNNLVGTDGRDLINAQGGDDTLFGGAGDDHILAGKGDDIIQGGIGDDTMAGGHGDDTFVYSDADFDGASWTDAIDGQGTNGKAPASDNDTIDLTSVTQGWTLEVDGAGPGAEATNFSNPTQYTNGGEFSGTITFDDGSAVVFDNIEKVDW